MWWNWKLYNPYIAMVLSPQVFFNSSYIFLFQSTFYFKIPDFPVLMWQWIDKNRKMQSWEMPTHSLFANKSIPHLLPSLSLLMPKYFIHTSDITILVLTVITISSSNFHFHFRIYQSSLNKQPLSACFDWRQNQNTSVFLKLQCKSNFCQNCVGSQRF